ncbi:MAG: MFS transporter [Candidatus Rokubacteria bacterium]|nr:MFS transporter [Candidatus Rokubacteria bacterium]
MTGGRRALGIAALTLAVQNGIVMAFAVLYLPLVTEFAAPRRDVAGVQSVALLLGGFTGPLVGWGLDRLGPRRFFPACAVVAACGLVLASRAGSLGALTLTYGVLGGLGLSGLGSQANMTVAALWYPRARGQAIALVDLGTGLGAFAFIPLAQTLVALVDWRGVLLVWAALLLAVIAPANLLQRLPGPAPAAAAPAAAVPTEPAGWTLARAARTAAFWNLVASRGLSAMAFPLMNVHMVAFAIGAGVEPAQAAAALGSVSLVSLGGRLCTGWLADRIGRAQTLSITYASAVGGIACLAALGWQGWRGWLLGYVLLYGVAQGSSGIVASARTADIFAGPTFATIYGWMSLAVGPGEAIGAWAGGAIYDATGSYLGGFGFVALALVLGAATMWRVRQPAGST